MYDTKKYVMFFNGTTLYNQESNDILLKLFYSVKKLALTTGPKFREKLYRLTRRAPAGLLIGQCNLGKTSCTSSFDFFD